MIILVLGPLCQLTKFLFSEPVVFNTQIGKL
jgi:hypothetical protein